MVVNRKTRISTLIAEDSKVIDTIASINKHFNKLKNPVLRRVLAPRVTIEDAAKIGGVTINVFLKKLAEVGFEIEPSELEGFKNINEEKITDTHMNKENLVSLDVRPIISGGSDPFKEIMAAVKKLVNNQTLEIINSFEPIPLINKLKRQGYKTWTEKSENGTVHSFFIKDENIAVEQNEKSENITVDFDEKFKEFVGKLKQIDVRHLEMPEPMTTILEELELLQKGHALFVEHKKVPQFLLPELKSRGFDVLYNKKTEDHLQLLIFKA